MGTTEQPRTYVTMAGKSIGQCSSGHWLPLKGDCDLCGAGPYEKCRYDIARAIMAERERCAQFAFAKYDWPPRWIAASLRGENDAYGDEFFSAVERGEIKVNYE